MYIYTHAQVCAGHMHALALSDQGQVFAWGYGGDSMALGAGALGLGDKRTRKSAEHVKALESHKIVSIACGGQHSGALTDRGEVFTVIVLSMCTCVCVCACV
jgi:alpha-tubulin suppressor-like RCC1 family protein